MNMLNIGGCDNHRFQPQNCPEELSAPVLIRNLADGRILLALSLECQNPKCKAQVWATWASTTPQADTLELQMIRETMVGTTEQALERMQERLTAVEAEMNEIAPAP